jgi:chromosome segregation ATPase
MPSPEGGRGREASITKEDFRQAAAELRGQGKQPTFANLRALLGGVSYPVLRRLLDEMEAEERSAGQLGLPQELASSASAWFEAAKAAAAKEARAALSDAYAEIARERETMRAALEEQVAARDEARGLAARYEGRADALEAQVTDLQAQRTTLESQFSQAVTQREGSIERAQGLSDEVAALTRALGEERAAALQAQQTVEARTSERLESLVREVLLAKDELRERGRAMGRVERAVDRLVQAVDVSTTKHAGELRQALSPRFDALDAVLRTAVQQEDLRGMQHELATLVAGIDARLATWAQPARVEERAKRGRK